jgi:glucan phosphoethanolaminetransferase (alkaline phosphatase superfamily)
MSRLSNFKENQALFYNFLFYEVSISLILGFITLYAFAFNRKIFLIFGTSIAFLGAIVSYFVKHYQITIDHNLLGLVLDTDKREAIELIDMYLMTWCIIISLSSYMIIAKLPVKHSTLHASLALVIFILLSVLDRSRVNYRYFPFNVIKTIYHHIELKIFDPVPKAIAKLTEYNFTPPSPKEDLYIVMIIGETARADHFSLNGYHRSTNPKLNHASNLVSFSDFHSFANSTRLAIPRMLSSITENKVSPLFNVIDVFNIVNFNTSWFGSHGNRSFNRSYLKRARSAKYHLFLSDLLKSKPYTDLDLIPYIENHIKQSTGNNLIVIHTLGSHWDYDSRIVDQFKQFQPLCSMQSRNISMTGCSLEGLINSYDNTILQTDYFISEIIDIFKNKNAFILYSSDHGEALGENGIYGHGGEPTVEQFHVAAIAWASDKFIHYNKDKFQHLKSFKNKYLNHDFLFHSLLDCAGVESDLINKKYSMCTTNP